jgi:sn-glycerol 3-phosphate transport system permease protein
VKESVLALAFLAPALAAFGMFAYAPFVQLLRWGTYRSVHNGRSYTPVGLSQYQEVLTGPDFREGLWHSLQFVIYTVPISLVLGTLLAVAADRRLRGIRIFQTIFASTIASSTAVAAVAFFFLINPVIGVFRVDWLTDPDFAMFGVALPNIWQSAGGAFVIVLAGLQAIPEEVVEAARLDGYGPVRRLFRITLPLISPVLLFLVVILSIGGLQAFAEVDVLTAGGPTQSTETLLFKIAQDNQPATMMIGSVLAVGLFAVTALVTLLQFALLEKRVHYGN